MTTTKVKIWTRAYRPFIMGGNVHAPIGCEVDASGPYALGAGYMGYLVVSPTGRTFVAEKTSGALVGPSLQEVRADVAAASWRVMEKQVDEALKLRESVVWLEADRFWRMMARDKS